MSVLLFFIDGIGIGEFDPERNPFARFPAPLFPGFKDRSNGEVAAGGILVPTEVRMGVPGLPQSATGQTALLTGENAAQLLGRHHPGFPTVSLRKLISEESIFLKIERLGLTATFANAFTPAYFKRSERSISATTWSLKASGFPFRWLQPELHAGRAVSHDLTNEFLRRLGLDAPLRTPEEAGQILAEITAGVDFCLFEYFITDAIGHGQDMEWAETELEKLNRCLDVLLETLSLAEHLIVVTSDHGNFEDLSVPGHTLNAVPTTLWGKGKEAAAGRIRRIEDVCGAILAHLQLQAHSPG